MAQTHKHAHCSELSRKLLHRKCYAEMTDLIKYLKMAHANKKIYILFWTAHDICCCGCLRWPQCMRHIKSVFAVCVCACVHTRGQEKEAYERWQQPIRTTIQKSKPMKFLQQLGKQTLSTRSTALSQPINAKKIKTVSLNLQIYSCLCLMLQRLTQGDLKGLSDQISCILHQNWRDKQDLRMEQLMLLRGSEANKTERYSTANCEIALTGLMFWGHGDMRASALCLHDMRILG